MHSGYELFFNRDEQRCRAQALPPRLNTDLSAIYPIDPVGNGTWLAVHQSGLSLALLNFYQAEKKAAVGQFISRGELILTLLKRPDRVIETLQKLPLSRYQPFQLCFFPVDLCRTNKRIICFQWNGKHLLEVVQSLPITSSSVDYEQVYQARKLQFAGLVATEDPTTAQFLQFHQSQQTEGKLSVQMSRKDAQTVSFSHICVSEEITFCYVDYLDKKHHALRLPRHV